MDVEEVVVVAVVVVGVVEVEVWRGEGAPTPLPWVRAQPSLGSREHRGTGRRCGESRVTMVHLLPGTRSHTSTGTSTSLTSTSSLHSSPPSTNRHPTPHNLRGVLLQLECLV